MPGSFRLVLCHLAGLRAMQGCPQIESCICRSGSFIAPPLVTALPYSTGAENFPWPRAFDEVSPLPSGMQLRALDALRDRAGRSAVTALSYSLGCRFWMGAAI